MKAAFYERKGDAHHVLRLGSLPDPDPAAGEVRVRVHVSAINPSDTKTRQGWGGQETMPFPRVIPHNDGAGVIDRVGSGVSGDRVGERVWVFEAQRDNRAFGTAADYVVVPNANAVRLPDVASFDDGASMGVPGMTAHHLLFGAGPVHGKTVLVQGGAGSVGHLAVQLARWAGARVIATAGSDDQTAVAKACGAHHVINYRTGDVIAEVAGIVGGAGGVDHVLEVALVKNLDIDAAVLKPSGTISTFMVDEDPTHQPTVNLQQLSAKDLTVRFTLVYAMSRAAHEVAIIDLTAALAAGALKPRIARRLPLERIADAHELLGTKGAGGKVLLDVG